MKAFEKKHIALLCSVFIIGVAYILFNNQALRAQEQDGTLVSKKVKSINLKLDNEINKVRVDVLNITKALDQNDIFKLSHLQYKTKYPFYVIKNGQLIYWSDQKFAFETDMIIGNFVWKVINVKSGSYILNKRLKENKLGKFEIIFAIPLYVHYQIENNYLTSQYNEAIFGKEEVEFFSEKKGDGFQLLIDGRTYLTSMKFLPHSKYADNFGLIWILIVFTGIGCYLYYVYLQSKQFFKRRKFFQMTLFLFSTLFVLRAVMLYAGFPSKFVATDLFDSKFFAYSSVFPSLGDLFLNVLCLTVVVVCFYSIFPFLSLYKKVPNYNSRIRRLLSVGCVILSYIIAISFFSILKNLYFNSQWDYDITEKINFTMFEFFYMFIFVLLTCLFFLFNRVIFRVVFKLNSHEQKESVVSFFIAGVIVLLINKFFLKENNIIFLINTIYVTAIYYQGLFINFHRFRYGAYVYLIATAITSAGIGSVAILENSDHREQLEKERFADQLILHHDYQGEFLLGEVGKQIEQDAFIKDVILKPFASKTRIFQKIRRSYLSNYFDKYEVNVLLYDINGSPFYKNKIPGNYNDLYERYNKDVFKTDVDNLFFVNYYDEDNLSKYMKFITLKKKNDRVGYIVINLTLKKINPNSVYPILLQNKKYISTGLKKSYNYAVYDDKELLYSAGEFNYESQIKKYFQDVEKGNGNAFVFRGYHHYSFEGVHGKRVIVSSKNERMHVYVTNFSFLFLTLILCLFISIVLFSLYPISSRQNITNYSTKIHVYLNLAYLFPLVVVSITTLGIINSTYEADLETSFKSKGESIGANLINYLERFEKGEISEDAFEASIQRLTKYSESDINLFDTTGKLMMTTQPLIYEANLLSRYLNPEAMVNIFETKHKLALIEEEIGKFKYKSVYVSLVLQDSGKILGILSIPFYNSKYELNDKKIVVFSSIMNIFTLTFILILVLSYFASQALTHPLRLISQKLKRTTLGGDNEKLEWQARDEIGILVHEYNEMIEKLDDSKDALAKKEKESAWKEMAQQVAHEIKNPLTPMKLKIQHLQRTLGTSAAAQESLQVLLHQVDTLSDIATSFSSFAKMPIPIIEQVDVTQVIQDTLELYKDNNEVVIDINVPDEAVIVNADQQLMGRIFTNIVLNGIQSVPKSRKPLIHIKMYVNELNEAVIAFSDNGKGIPVDIRDKVFIPNFSTKYSGSGIGLALAKRGVEHAGGSIWFESKEGEGTTFFIILPAKKK